MRPWGPIMLGHLLISSIVFSTPTVIRMEALVDNKSTPAGKSRWHTFLYGYISRNDLGWAHYPSLGGGRVLF